jgi:hypothetical protein
LRSAAASSLPVRAEQQSPIRNSGHHATSKRYEGKRQELAKRGIDAYNRRDIDTFAELTTADFEWFPALDRTVEGGSYRGREGIETYLGDIRNTWEEYRVLGDEFRDQVTACSCSGGLRSVGRAAASPSMRRSGLSSIFAAAGVRAIASIPITARRCGRQGCLSRRQVVV